MLKECFYSGVVGKEQAKSGVFWLSQNSKPNGGWLAVDSRQVLRNLSRHSGLGPLRELLNIGKRKILINGVSIEIVTKKTIPKNGKNRPLVAIEPNKDFLEELDTIPNISKMLVVPFIVDEADDWVSRNNAKHFGRLYDDDGKELNNVTKTALRYLTNVIRSSRQRYPVNSLQHAITSTLHLLEQNGYDIDPAAIRYCLIHEFGWKPVSATLVEEYADIMRSGEREFSGLDVQYWNIDMIHCWRKEARGSRDRF